MLFFGTGRPFSMNTETWTAGIFPPAPSTIYGFLRSIYFENNTCELPKAATENDPTKNLIIHDFQLASDKDLLFPIPNCFLIKKDKSLIKLKLEHKKIVSNYPFSHYLIATEDGKMDETKSHHYVTEEQLNLFLQGKPVTDFEDINEYQTINDRIGISKNYSTGKAEDGKLYRIAFNELETIKKDFSELGKLFFYVTISGLEIPKLYKRRLGGEGKIAILEKTDIAADKSKMSIQKAVANTSDTAVIYFASQAVFTEEPKNCFDSFQVEIICISNKATTKISGWDIKGKKPKPAKNVIPAGTLFFIKFNEISGKEKFIETFHGACIGDKAYTKQGFGKIYIGNY